MAIPKRPDLISLICAILFFGSCPATALDQESNILEISSDVNTYSYDLNTLHMIQSGRFTIVFTVIDQPDVMRLELKVLDALRTYCGRPDGKYPAPAHVFTLGPPDCPSSNDLRQAGQRFNGGAAHLTFEFMRRSFDVASVDIGW